MMKHLRLEVIMMPKKTCFFLGHADTPSSVYPFLLSAIERHITEHGVTDFFLGYRGSFDHLSLRALKELKTCHPHIRIIYVQPYHPGLQPSEPDGFDESLYPFDMPVHPRFAISKANRQMIKTSVFLIACVRHSGNSRSFFEYALVREQKGLIHITNLAEYLPSSHIKRTWV